MSANPQNAFASLSLFLKFGLDPCYSFGYIVILIFCRLGLKLPIHAHFGEIWGHISPNMVTYRSKPQKDHPCAETRRLSHKA